MKQAGVKSRIRERRAEQNAKSEFSRDEYRKYLVRVMMTPVGEIDEQHELCQEVKVT